MLIGLIAGILTGALWGLTFVAPRAVFPFTELDLAFARYAIFGLLSLALMIFPAFQPRGITLRRWLLAIMLGGFGYVGYYIFVAFAVRFAGPAIPPLVIGALPIAMAIIGNWQDRNVRWRQLALPLGLIAAGLLIVNLSTLSNAGTASQQANILLGTACAFGAFLIWLLYGIINAAVMRSEDAPKNLPWTGLQGIGALIWALPILPLSFYLNDTAWSEQTLSNPQSINFLIWAVILGTAGSWLATWFWVIASSKLPLALSAQLIVSETVFALIYGFAFEGRWPMMAEWIGAAFLLIGVGFGVDLFRHRAASSIPV